MQPGLGDLHLKVTAITLANTFRTPLPLNTLLEEASGRQPYTAAGFWASSGGFIGLACISQGTVFMLDGIFLGDTASRRLPSPVPGVKATRSSTEQEAAEQGSRNGLPSGRIKPKSNVGVVGNY